MNDLHAWAGCLVSAVIASAISYRFGFRHGEAARTKYFRAFWKVLMPEQRQQYSEYLLSDKP